MSDWTETRVTELTELWKAGLTAAQLMDKFPGFSRSAICGKLDRLGLKRKAEVRHMHSASENSKRERKPFYLAGQHRTAVRERAPVKQTFDDLPPDESPNAVTLLNLKEGQCKWPLGDPQREGFMFCGSDSEGSYCARHCQVAYVRG